MNRKERALHYFERFIYAENKKSELGIILRDLDALVYASSKLPLSNEDKLLILEEFERLIKDVEISNESSKIIKSLSLEEQRKLITAADNSGILDAIATMKGRLRK